MNCEKTLCLSLQLCCWCGRIKGYYLTYSLASFKISSTIWELNLKFVWFILDRIGLIPDIKPAFFASKITPKVPVITNANFIANFRPFNSSIINRQSFCSNAKAIALASPLSLKVLIQIGVFGQLNFV